MSFLGLFQVFFVLGVFSCLKDRFGFAPELVADVVEQFGDVDADGIGKAKKVVQVHSGFAGFKTTDPLSRNTRLPGKVFLPNICIGANFGNLASDNFVKEIV